MAGPPESRAVSRSPKHLHLLRLLQKQAELTARKGASEEFRGRSGYAWLGTAMVAPLCIVPLAAVAWPSTVPSFARMFPLRSRTSGTTVGRLARNAALAFPPAWTTVEIFCNFWTFEILRLCAPGHANAHPLEGYKTVLILETPFGWLVLLSR